MHVEPALSATQEFENGHMLYKSAGGNIYAGMLTAVNARTFANPDTAAEAMYSDGFVIFPGVLDPAGVDALRTLIDSVSDASQITNKNGGLNIHVNANFKGDPRFLNYIDRPNVIDVVERVLGPQCQVLYGSTWITGKGRQMGIHVDMQPIRLPAGVAQDDRVRMPVFSCTAHFYLDDVTEELGPTLVIPGSHRAGFAPHSVQEWNGRAPQMVNVKAGDVCLFRHDLWHGAGANSSERRRYLLQIHYGRAGNLSLWNPQLGQITPEVRAAATPRQRKLLGIPDQRERTPDPSAGKCCPANHAAEVSQPAFNHGHFVATHSGDTRFRTRAAPLKHKSYESTVSAAEAMYTDGFVCFPAALDAAELHALRAFARACEDAKAFTAEGCDVPLLAHFRSDPRLLNWLDRDGVMDLIETLLNPPLGSDRTKCRLLGGALRVFGPDREIPIHLDWQALRLPQDLALRADVRVPVFSCSVQYYLDDPTPDNGGTLLIPGSHRAGRSPENESTWNGVAPQRVDLKAGGACLYRQDLWHGVQRNNSPHARRVLQLDYAYHLAGPPDDPGAVSTTVLALATPRQKRMLGSVS